jgi:hypothetical protein
MRRVDVAARSLAEMAALDALADIAAVVDDWADVRVVGGHMVHIHTVLAGVTPRTRRTVDTDIVGSVAVIGSGSLAQRLLADGGLGYRRCDGSRLARRLPSGHDALIDLMVPSRTSRARHNVRVGEFVVDAFPGLQTALRRSPTTVELHVTDLDGASRQPAVVAVPDLIAAVVVKALAARHSTRARDLDDVGHLLQCAAALGVQLPAPTLSNADFEKVAAYLHGTFVAGRSATTERRRLVQQVVPVDPRPDPFPNL